MQAPIYENRENSQQQGYHQTTESQQTTASQEMINRAYSRDDYQTTERKYEEPIKNAESRLNVDTTIMEEDDLEVLEGIEVSDDTETTTAPDSKFESSHAVWNLFQQKIQDKSYYLKRKDYPRKPMMIDADIRSTLIEIDIDNVTPTNLLNTILRAFIETYKEELRLYRKLQAPSVF